MDMETLAHLVPITWIPDRLAPQDAKPRHLGRPITFFYYDSTNEDDHRGVDVLGILEGVAGSTFIVSGAEYEWERMSQTRVWRREVKS